MNELKWKNIEELKICEDDVILVLKFRKLEGKYYPDAVFFNGLDEGTREVLPRLSELLGGYTRE